jgi:FkbM family methyltransferase
VVIDVGANIGFFTARFAKWVGPEGHVIAIEPEDINLEALTAKIQKLGFTSRVKICQALVAEREGVLRLRRNELHPGDHRISHTDEGIEVRAVTVDALSMSIGQRPISFIKIDVQGAETRVINGALDTIRRHKPTLFVEIDESALNEFGTSSNELVSLLQAEGYTMTLLEPDGTELSLTASALATRLAEKSYIDVLFLQP